VFYGEKKERGKDITIATYDTALAYLTREKYGLMIFDEGHHHPAASYSRLAFMDIEYRISMTASPFREDGNDSLIYVLGGPARGGDWDRLFRDGWVRKPVINLHIVSDKMRFLKQLLDKVSGKTMIFCDTIRIGEEASRVMGLPYAHGKHTRKMRDALTERGRFIVSRIYDESMDIKDVRNVIELDFMGGSRRQQLQRVGRLMHSIEDNTQYHLLMTPLEYTQHRKRLYGLYTHTFKVNLINED
jgi:DNA excision repair protein ERCC-3